MMKQDMQQAIHLASTPRRRALLRRGESDTALLFFVISEDRLTGKG